MTSHTHNPIVSYVRTLHGTELHQIPGAHRVHPKPDLEKMDSRRARGISYIPKDFARFDNPTKV